MHTRSLTAIAIAAAVATSFVACSSSNPVAPDGGNPEILDDGGSPGGPDGSVTTDGGPGSECLPDGNPCSTAAGGVCCSGTCDDTSGTCKPSGVFCGGPGDACANSADCCTNRCVNGACASTQCVDVGAACASASDCCTGLCNANGTCDPLPGAVCGVIGQSCSGGEQCCSKNCQGGVCVRAYYCQADNDICYGNDDCCGRSCSKNDGSPGMCKVITSGGGGTCTQGGNPCLNANNCCSRVCADPGTGVAVCQPAAGCALSGAYCDTAQDCCGGGTNPNGSVQCINNRCSNGTSCEPVGNLCGAKVLADGGSIPANQDCCDGKKAVCKADGSGIPRCFGGGSKDCPNGYDGTGNCCIPEGNECQFKDQCCGGAPCIPGADGKLRCTTSQCVPLGSTCTPGSDTCCAGGCLPTGGELSQYVCKFPPAPTDGGTVPGDGGSNPVDAGACAPNGTTCASAADCCSGTCDNGTCQTPTACQPQGTVCTATADCCSGLNCAIPAGSSTGTCQPSACSGAGQSCSSRNACCTGLTCRNEAGALCNDTTSCVCTVQIN